MAVHHHVVAALDVVAERELHVLERLEPLAAALEDVRREQPPEPHAELDVLPARGEPVERVPEPEQRLHALELLVVDVGVVLRLERDVARVERGEREARAERNLGVRERGLVVRRRTPGTRSRTASRGRTARGRASGSFSEAPMRSSQSSCRAGRGRRDFLSGLSTMGDRGEWRVTCASTASPPTSATRPASAPAR